MGFYMLLTVALLLTSLMNVEATPVDQAERSALEKSGLGNRIQPRYDNCGDAEADCYQSKCMDEETYDEECEASCNYVVANCI
nr:putative turritoxin IX-02 precursor [Gemmula speciosa]